MNTTTNKKLLVLFQSSLWNQKYEENDAIDWEVISKLSKEQGVTNFIYDGVKSAGIDMPEVIKKSWKSQLLSGMFQNERLLIAQDAVVRRFVQAGIPVAVLKGSSVARYYPQPELRALGDIDLLVNKCDLASAKELLLQDGFVECDFEHDFHIGFSKGGVYLELHEQVTTFPYTPGGQAAKVISEGFLERLDVGSVCGYSFPVLGRADQALSLLLHMVRHMCDGGIGLRQLCDWMLFAKAECSHFTEKICPVLKQCGLLTFAEIATGTCVQYLGLDPSYCGWCGDIDEETCELFLDSVFRGGNMGSAGTDSMGSLFTDENSMGDNVSPASAFIRKINRIIYKRFPFVKRYKILLPVFWIYLPVRYLARSLVGLRPKKSLKKTVGTAKKQRKLFDDLHLFEI